MRAVGPAWAQTLAASHQMRGRVELWAQTEKIADLALTEGSVTLDLDSWEYAVAEVTLAEPDRLARTETDPLTPFGNTLRVHWGLRAPTGWEEVALGELRLVETPTYAGALSQYQVRAASDMVMVADARFLVPWSPQPGATARQAMTELLTGAVPGATVSFADGLPDPELPGDLLFEESRREAVAAIAERMDALVRAEALGAAFSVVPVPKPVRAGPVAWTVATGVNLLAGTVPVLARDQHYNAVVARHPEDPTVWAVAYQTEGPTRWDGPFGRRPAFYASPLLTAATVQAAADTRLASINGRVRLVEFECVANGAVEPGDLLGVTWPGGAYEEVMVRSVTIPLHPAPMKVKAQAGDAT